MFRSMFLSPLLSLFLLLPMLLPMLPAGAAEPPIILVFGDSLSAGYGLPTGQAWPSLLQSRLEAEHLPWRVVNASISGETTAGGRSRMVAALRKHNPAIVAFELGANDGLRGLPLSAMRENLVAMISESRHAGARVLLIGMRLPPNFGPLYAGEFARSFSDLAKREHTSFVPFLLAGFADRPEMFQPDGLHPVAAAQPLILETVWPELRKMLGK
ncbi:MAG: arylesterase [Rhodocyclaceae bacterium]|nr:arylesterase [Rhodocyclaceae bacterium]